MTMRMKEKLLPVLSEEGSMMKVPQNLVNTKDEDDADENGVYLLFVRTAMTSSVPGRSHFGQ